MIEYESRISLVSASHAIQPRSVYSPLKRKEGNRLRERESEYREGFAFSSLLILNNINLCKHL
jgi:hypothetical protein